jgi:hypothetical protein
VCVRVLSLSTPFELAFVKSLREPVAKLLDTDHWSLLAASRIDKSHPASRPKKNCTRQFPCLWCWVKGNGINPFVKITRPFTTSPKAWKKTEGISSQVQIITMMSSTVDCRGKVRWPEQKAIAEAASSATCIMLCGWTGLLGRAG